MNTVGVMGKGIALQFKRAYPANYAAYRAACAKNEVRLGRMFVFDSARLGPRRYVINFPTKGHWRASSKLSDIQAGLADLVRVVRERQITSIAVPALGCGNGGLGWDEVRPVIEHAFAESSRGAGAALPTGERARSSKRDEKWPGSRVTDLERGVYEHIVTRDLADRLQHIDPALIQHANLDPADAPDALARHIAALARRALHAVGGGDDKLHRQVELANRIADTIAVLSPQAATVDDQVTDAKRLLHAIAAPPTPPAAPAFPIRPTTPLSTGALLVNGRHQPRIGHEVTHEMASADQVDLLCAFIKWHGLRQIERAIRDLIDRGGRLRVITTTYLGATDQRALDRLAELGADIKVSYETRTTRLHAKAWLFRRNNGTTTAYVGSSNLSKTALVDGVEWNVRISNMEQPYVIDTFTATFEDYWHDPAFEEYDPAGTPTGSAPRCAGSAATARRRPRSPTWTCGRTRTRRRSWPTSTPSGKSTAAGATSWSWPPARARRSWRRSTTAGCTARRPSTRCSSWRIRSRSCGRACRCSGRSWGTAASARRSSGAGRRSTGGTSSPRSSRCTGGRSTRGVRHGDRRRVPPRGSADVRATAGAAAAARTPGIDRDPRPQRRRRRARWFDGRAAVELHLWEALERQLLAPFQYFGLHDDVDLSQLRWKRGQGYDPTELDGVYTGNDARARMVLRAVRDTVDVGRMRALGFCVSIGHAEFMADWFTKHGVPAAAVTSGP